MPGYKDVFQKSINSPSEFWLDAAGSVSWDTEPTIGVNTGQPPFNKWFEDGKINACYNALDYHVENGRGDQILSLIHISEPTRPY